MSKELEEFKEQAQQIVDSAEDSVGPGETGTFAAKMIQPEDDSRESIPGSRDKGWW